MEASLAGKAFAFSLADARRHGPVVVYYYPAAFTEGCNVQAHEFAVKMEKFQAAGATVIGVSLYTQPTEVLMLHARDDVLPGSTTPLTSVE